MRPQKRPENPKRLKHLKGPKYPKLLREPGRIRHGVKLAAKISMKCFGPAFLTEICFT